MTGTLNNNFHSATEPASIGFFDSGQGGLTVWEAMNRHFPKLNTVYLGDNARYPYGNKSAETVTRYSSEAAFFFTRQNVRLMIVACGTASSVAVQELQDIFKIPIVGIVSGFCAQVAKLVAINSQIPGTQNGTVAVLGTRYTVSSGTFYRELTKSGVDRVWQMACPLFVPLVEEGVVEGEIANSICHKYLEQMPTDTQVVMLACTHYPRLEKCIGSYLNKKFKRTIIAQRVEGADLLFEGSTSEPPIYLLDSSLGIYHEISSFLNSQPNRHEYFLQSSRLYCTDAPTRFNEVARAFLNEPRASFCQVTLGV